MIDFKRGLEAQVKVGNIYLNRLLRNTGKVYSTDLYKVLTRPMREKGAIALISPDDYPKLDTSVDHVFIAIREAV